MSYRLFVFLSNRFLGSFGFFVLETLTPKQINHIYVSLNEYKVWYFALLAARYRRVQSLDWIVMRGGGVGGLSCVLATYLPSVVEEKGEGFENGKIRGFEV